MDNVLIALKDIKESLITLVHGRGVGIAHLQITNQLGVPLGWTLKRKEAPSRGSSKMYDVWWGSYDHFLSTRPGSSTVLEKQFST